MGHHISGIVAKRKSLMTFATTNGLHPPADLNFGLGFLPLSDRHLDLLFPVQGEFDDSMTYLSEALKKTLAMLSTNEMVAYVETDYFGGHGAQGATVYNRGQCIFGPLTNSASPISDAMRLLEITVGPGQHDEFEAVGFCRLRDNEDWIEESMQNQK